MYDYLDRSRAVNVFLNSIPALSMYTLREGQAKVGCAASNQICIWDTLMDSTTTLLTGNTSTMYAVGFLDLEKDGPTVIDLPPGMLGILDDMAFHYMTDLGVAGPDKGKGGKFLVLPPGYKGDVPDGYFVVPSKTNGVWVFMRGYLDKGLKAASENIRNNLKVYPLAKGSSPDKMEFINVSGKAMDTVLPNDYSFFEKLHALIQTEPADYLGPEAKGMMAAIGIEKGKPFNPDARMKKILVDAAAIGNAAARAISYFPRDPGNLIYGENSAWVMAYANKDTTFTTNGAYRLDPRVLFHFRLYLCLARHGGDGGRQGLGLWPGHAGCEQTGAGRIEDLQTAPATEPAGQGFLGCHHVRHPDTFTAADGSAVPDAGQPGQGIKKNADGSYDIYFAPKPPKGQESNWLQTIPGKSWWIGLRMYGPEQAWIDKTWRPGEIELVE